MPWPTRRPTLEDVAARAGVSRALVSLVIRDAPGPGAETRMRVLQAVADLGYRPDAWARLLARGRSHLLGVLFDVGSPFHAELLDSLYAAAEQAGYQLVLSGRTASRDDRRALEPILDFRCEALIVLTPAACLSTVVGRVPVVVIGPRALEPCVDVVRTADDAGLGQAVEHLVLLGHEEIVHTDGGPGPVSAARRRAYRNAMRQHGLRERMRIVPAGATEHAGAHVAQRLLDHDSLPTAIVAFNDASALGLLEAFARAGVMVPDQVSVVGYEDGWQARLPRLNLTTVGPDLTTVGPDSPRTASAAVDRAIARVHGHAVGTDEIVVEPRLHVRGTTGPPRLRVSTAPRRGGGAVSSARTRV